MIRERTFVMIKPDAIQRGLMKAMGVKLPEITYELRW